MNRRPSASGRESVANVPTNAIASTDGRCRTGLIAESPRGFTLVELMIALAIIGVLAGIAVPIYVDQASRAQVARVHAELSGYTRQVDDRLAFGDRALISSDPEDLLGFVDSNLSTTTFGTFEDEPSSTIEAVMDGDASVAVRGTILTLRRSFGGSWTCSVVADPERWDAAFLPSGCTLE